MTRASDATLLSVEGCEEQKKTEEEKPSWEGQRGGLGSEVKVCATQKKGFRYPTEWQFKGKKCAFREN